MYVNGFATPGGSTSYGLSNWVVPNSDTGSLDVSDSPVTAGVPETLTATCAGATNVTFITVG